MRLPTVSSMTVAKLLCKNINRVIQWYIMYVLGVAVYTTILCTYMCHLLDLAIHYICSYVNVLTVKEH